MKWTALVGILGVAVGFLIGRAGESPLGPGKEGGGVVERSDRSLGATGRERRGGSLRLGERTGGHRPVEEILRSGEITTISGEARLMKWILELGSADFPEVLERLEGIEGMEGATDDPFGADPVGSDLVMLALSRWYELDGERVLEWVMENGELPFESKLTALIKDGYARDPEGSFKALRRYVRQLGGVGGLSSSWYFEVARWSQDLQADLSALDELFSEYGIRNPQPDDPFASGDGLGAEYYLPRGAIAAGREDELRAVLGDQHPEVLRELEALENQKAVDAASQGGWQALRAGIERGDFQDDFSLSAKIYKNWVQDDPYQATEWLLREGVENREDRIVLALQLDNWGWGMVGGDPAEIDPLEVAKRIQEFDSQGEPVGQAWERLATQIVDERRWEEMESLRTAVPQELWESMVETVYSEGIRENGIRMSDGGWIAFHYIDSESLSVFQRFGLKEKALQEVAKRNEESLRKLHHWLGVE